MGKDGPRNPRPPKSFGQRKLPKKKLGKRTLFRVSARPPEEAVFYSKKGIYRFDFENPPYGVCYFGLSEEAAIMETLGEKLRLRKRFYTSELDLKRIYKFVVDADTPICPFHGENLTVMGATGQVLSGNYSTSRAWSKAIMNHSNGYGGMLYDGRLCQKMCLALFGDGKKPFDHESALTIVSETKLSECDLMWEKINLHEAPVTDDLA